jgi:hypothetical protein
MRSACDSEVMRQRVLRHKWDASGQSPVSRLSQRYLFSTTTRKMANQKTLTEVIKEDYQEVNPFAKRQTD